MNSFDFLWQLLEQHGVIPSKKQEAISLWNTLPLQQQRQIYRCIRDKIQAGKFVHYNPVLAIRENLRPVKQSQPPFLSGQQQDECRKKGIPMVQVHYGDKFLICTKQTQEDFGLTKTIDW